MIDTNKIYTTIRNEKAYINSRLNLIVQKFKARTFFSLVYKLFIIKNKKNDRLLLCD